MDVSSLSTAHDAAVTQISRTIARFHASKTPFRIFHGTTNSTRPSVRTHSASVDISSLHHVLSVSPATRTCVVEPNVPMDALVAATLPCGLVPPVVPEFPGITVGGAFAGTAGESSSFRHGFFDTCVKAVEVVLADGRVVWVGGGGEERKGDGDATGSQYADLLDGMAGTFGTLGVATLFEICLVPAREYVELAYIPVSDVAQAQEVMKQVIANKRTEGEGEGQGVDFLDGIMFAPDRGVVMTGRFADRDTGRRGSGSGTKGVDQGKDVDSLPVVTFTRPWDEWFYLHAEKRMEEAWPPTTRTGPSDPGPAEMPTPIPSPSAPSAVHRDLIPLTDYLFRYDRGAFWTARYAYSYFLIPFYRATRWLLDPFMHTRPMYHALHRSGFMQHFIIQDLAVPMEGGGAKEFSAWLDEELPNVYPRWLCPLKAPPRKSMSPHHPHHPHSAPADADTETKAVASADNMLLNVGLWGPTPPHTPHVAVNRRIEAKLQSLGGMKWLYAQTFYTEDEFWQIYDRAWYEALREKYRAQRLPSVYDKVRTEFGGAKDGHDGRAGIEKGLWSIWPLAGVYGVLSLIKGGDYLRKSR